MFIFSSLLLLLNFCGDASDSQKLKNSDTSLVSESPVVISEELQTATEEMTPSESKEEEPELPIAQRVSPADQNGSLMEQRWFRPVFVAVTFGIFFIGGKLFLDQIVKQVGESVRFETDTESGGSSFFGIEIPEPLRRHHYLKTINYYETLGVESTVEASEIKSNYKKLSREVYPKADQGDAAMLERFKEISEAYETLSDPKLRVLYDNFLKVWRKK